MFNLEETIKVVTKVHLNPFHVHLVMKTSRIDIIISLTLFKVSTSPFMGNGCVKARKKVNFN